MEVTISKEIFEKYPYLEVGVIVCRDICNNKQDDDIQKMIKEVVEEKRQQVDNEDVAKIPTIAKWREIYKSFGAKPKDYKCSCESLLKRILKKDMPMINSLVDIYNYVSMKFVLTAGGGDLDTIEGNLFLDFAIGDEEFIPLGEESNNPPWKGEVIYKDNKGVTCRCFNWREGDRTKLTENTKNALLVVENIIESESDTLSDALNELKMLIEKYCFGKCDIKILNKENQIGEFKNGR